MKGQRDRNETGKLRRKRDDTHLWTLEEQYHVKFPFRGDMELGTLRKKWNEDSVEKLVERARKLKE